MSTIEKLRPITITEYLENEQISEIKHEYVQGYIYPMVGASNFHNLIALALAALLRTHLRGTDCRVFLSDMKVRIDDVFYYPDIFVACQNQKTLAYFETDPKLIVEVLSPSTEARDRFEKRLAYQRIDSLQEYVLIAQDKLQVDIYRRQPKGWEIEKFGVGDQVHFRSVAYSVAIETIYEDVIDQLG